MESKNFDEKWEKIMKHDRSILPPEYLLKAPYYHISIERYRISEYYPRSDCSNCMIHYDLAKRLNKTKEQVVLLVKKTGVDDVVGDIIGIEVV